MPINASVSPLPSASQVADLPLLKQRLAELEEAAAASDLWEQKGRAQAVLQQLTQLRDEAAQLDRFCGQLEDLAVALELLEMEVGARLAALHCQFQYGR